MSAIILAVGGLTAVALGYRFYSKFIAEKIYQLDPGFETPAHTMRDDVDFIPTNRVVLWGHHFTAVAGAAPIIGPAIAVVWGWVPAFLWVIGGTIFFAGVHDFGAIWASVRNKGTSVGSLTGEVVGPRARTLFMIVIFLLLLMVNAVFCRRHLQRPRGDTQRGHSCLERHRRRRGDRYVDLPSRCPDPVAHRRRHDHPLCGHLSG